MRNVFVVAVCCLTFVIAPTAVAQLVADMLHESVPVALKQRPVFDKEATPTYESLELHTEFNGVMFQGVTFSEVLKAEVRFSDGDVAGPWLPARVIRSASGDGSFAGGYRGDEFRQSDYFELRFVTDPDADIQIVASGTFDNRLDTDSFGNAAKSGSDTRAINTKAVEPPPLITRQNWEADPFIRGDPIDLAPNGVQYMTFHHAAGFRATSREEGIAQVKAIQDLHQDIRGWSDIGYQFVIDRGGRVYQGRPFMDESTTLEEIPALARGAHVGNFNTGNIGVCLLGCYHPSEGSHCTDEITPEAMATYITLFGFFSEAYDVAPEQIRGHRDFSSTACPGDNNYALIPQIITDVEDVIVFGNEQPDTYAIEANYPNPVSGNTTFRYFLEESGIVSLKVYDVAGREVAEVVNEHQEGPRWYTTDYDAGELASGMYYYRVRVDGFSGIAFDDTRSLVVVSQ